MLPYESKRRIVAAGDKAQRLANLLQTIATNPRRELVTDLDDLEQDLAELCDAILDDLHQQFPEEGEEL